MAMPPGSRSSPRPTTIRKPFRIFPGQVLTIPDLPGSAPPPRRRRRRFYDDPDRFGEIASSNEIADPGHIWSGAGHSQGYEFPPDTKVALSGVFISGPPDEF
jgi:hypothetical protein